MISTAVGTERVSRVVGYVVEPGDFSTSSPNLPQRIVILAEANTANQSGLDTTGVAVTSAQDAGDEFGYGSPIYNIMRVLRPSSGGGVGGIPTIVYAQAEVGTAAEREITVSGAATGNGTHTIIIGGRSNVDGASYNITIEDADTPTLVAAKIAAVVGNVLGSPVTGASAVAVATLTAKWIGATSDGLTVIIDTNGNDLGLGYAVVASVAGAGDPAIQDALDQFGNEWNTLVINSYGPVQFDTLEAFNGKPDKNVPTGRYTGIIFKPFFALYGEIEQDKDTIVAITDAAARKDQVTNVMCPSPNSAGFAYEAAANACAVWSRIAQDNPHLDLAGQSYPDMPFPSDGDIGDMSSYENRDFLVKRGASTVDSVSGKDQVQDFITTYHPDGEVPPAFRYVRNLNIDWNVRYGYFLLEQLYVIDHAIAGDNDTVKASNVIKPKEWIQILYSYADDLALRGLITDAAFMKESVQVQIGSTNPDRLETTFSYKRSGFGRVLSTTATAGFSTGS